MPIKFLVSLPERQELSLTFEDKVFKLLIEHNYRLLEKNGGKNHQQICSW